MSTHNAAIQPKYSHEAGVTPQPEELIGAEIAINTADAKIFTKNAAGEIVTIVGGGGGGGAVDSVNGETGAVSLGIQDMDDFELNANTIYSWSTRGGLSTEGNWNDASQNGGKWFKMNTKGANSEVAARVAALNDGDVVWVSLNNQGFAPQTIGIYNPAVYGSYAEFFSRSGFPGTQTFSSPLKVAFSDPNVDQPLTDGSVLQWVGADQKFKPAQQSIQDMDDIFIPTDEGFNPDKTVLQFDTSTSKWTAQDLDFTLEKASDYSLRIDGNSGNAYPKVEGDALLWNGTNWNPGNPLSGQVVSALNDVNTVTNPPSDGDALVWNELNGVWQPGAGGGGGGSESLEELSDVALDSEVAGDVLRFDGTNWTDGRVDYQELSNRPAIPAALSDLSDTDLSTAPAIGQILVWNGSAWAPDNQAAGGGGISTVGGALTERADTTVSTGSMNNGASQNIQFTGLGEAGQFVEVSVSSPSWIRFYPTAQDRDNDATRDVETDPLPGSGVLLEVVTTSANQTVKITPGAVYYNNDTLSDQTLYARVTNQSGASADLLVTVRAYTQTSTDSIDGGSFGSG